MAEHKIKLSAHTDDVRKSFLQLSRDVKEIGKSKITIFDRDQKEFLSKQAKAHLEVLKKKMQENRAEVQKTLKEMSNENKTLEEQIEIRKKLNRLTSEGFKMQKQHSQVQQMGQQMRGGIMGRLGGMMPGRLGGLMAGGAGLGMLGGLGMAGVGALGAFGFGRAVGGYNQFQGGMADRIALRGRGVGDMNLRNRDTAARAGMDAQAVRRARLESMDVFGEAGSTQEAVIQRAAFERNFGIQQGTMTGFGAQMRGTLGSEGAQKAVMTMQASLIASGITDEIGPYLETAANMLTTLNERGFTFNDSAMAVLSSLTRDGMTVERAGQMISGVDQAIRGSTGEANAFFQQAFSSAGIGGNTVGGIQAAIRTGGLMGANLGQYSMGATDRQAFEQTGIGGRTGQRVAQSTLGMLDQMFGSDEDIQSGLRSGDQGTRQAAAARRMQRLNFMRQQFGVQNEAQAAEINELLKKMADPQVMGKERAEVQKRMNEIQAGNTELGNLQKINESTAGSLDVLKNIHSSIKDELGAQMVPLFARLEQVMIKIDQALSGLLKFFGVDTPQDAVKDAVSGSDVLTKEAVEQASGGSSLIKKQMSEQLAGAYEERSKRLKELQAKADEKAGGAGRGKYYHLSGEERMEMQRLQQEKANLRESMQQTGLGQGNLSQAVKDEMFNEMLAQAKKDQKMSQMLDNPMQVFGGFLEDMKSAIFGTEKNKPATVQGAGKDPELEKQKLKYMQEQTKLLKKNVDATKSVGGVPNKGSKT